MSDDRAYGINPIIIDRTIGKRMVEGISGKGGLESLVMWLNQLDFISGLESLLNSISFKLMFYDTALTKCAKDALKRPEFQREDEIATLLGDVCVLCGKSYSVTGYAPSRCGCGGEIDSRYSLLVDEFEKYDINPVPEAVMMWVAYDGLAEAYFEAYVAFNRVLGQIVKQRGWDTALQFLDYELKDRLDYSFYYGEPGDLRIATEERQILMFLIRGNLAGVGLDVARELIGLGIGTVKFGHLFNQLFCSGADAEYNVKRAKFAMLYNKVNERIRNATVATRKEREKRVIEVLELADKRYYACSLLDPDGWISGKLSRHLFLKPLEKSKFPIFTDEDSVALNLFVAPSGSGKTTFMAGTLAHAVDWAGEVALNVMGDEKNALTLSCLPMFPCEGHTGALLKTLSGMGVYPKPIPCLNLTFLREDELDKALSKDKWHMHPPTVYDRIVDVPETFRFGFRFESGKNATVESKEVVGNRGVLNILRDFALEFGYKRVCGVINARNLLRKEKSDYEKETKPDIQVSTVLFDKFVTWRPNSKSPSMRIIADEMSRLCPVTHAVAGSDTSKSSATVSDAIKMLRGLNTSFDGGTQRFSEINPDARAEALNIFFRELPQSGDKSRSQRDIVLSSLELAAGRAEGELVAQVMERKVFPRDEFFWFWWNKHRGSVQVVKPVPPTFMINQPKKTNLEVFREYERFSGKRVLLDSWDDVPHLNYEEDEYAGKRGWKMK